MPWYRSRIHFKTNRRWTNKNKNALLRRWTTARLPEIPECIWTDETPSRDNYDALVRFSDRVEAVREYTRNGSHRRLIYVIEHLVHAYKHASLFPAQG